MMTYKGYIGVAQVDDEAGVIRGKVVNTKDTITFQGTTVEGAKTAFRESIDDYLEFCESSGERPEKPFSGKFLVRINPRLHRDLTAIAQAKGISVNKMVTRELGRLARRPQVARVLPPHKGAVPGQPLPVETIQTAPPTGLAQPPFRGRTRNSPVVDD